MKKESEIKEFCDYVDKTIYEIDICLEELSKEAEKTLKKVASERLSEMFSKRQKTDEKEDF